jgi:putative Mn2+ efflux pump MntP
VIEALTPLIGWFLGKAAAQYVSAWDHWIAFTLLVILGARMVFNSFSVKEADETKAAAHSFWLLAVTGLATSIDAMAVGAGLAFVDVNIYSTAAAIGLATATMVTIGVLLGRVIGRDGGRCSAHWYWLHYPCRTPEYVRIASAVLCRKCLHLRQANFNFA